MNNFLHCAAIGAALLAVAVPAKSQDVQERVIKFGHLDNAEPARVRK